MSTLPKLAGIRNIGTMAALGKLAEVYRESRSNAQQPVPIATLYLKSGLSMRGQVLALTEDMGPASALFLIHESKSPEPLDLTYVLVDEIAALTVHGAAAIIDHLSDGQIARAQGVAPTRADLARFLKTILDEINGSTGATMLGELRDIPDNAPADVHHALYLTLRDLYTVLKQIASDEIGAQALRERGFHFLFRLDQEPAVQINKSKCAIILGLVDEVVHRPSRESLRMNIEEFL